MEISGDIFMRPRLKPLSPSPKVASPEPSSMSRSGRASRESRKFNATVFRLKPGRGRGPHGRRDPIHRPGLGPFFFILLQPPTKNEQSQKPENKAYNREGYEFE